LSRRDELEEAKLRAEIEAFQANRDKLKAEARQLEYDARRSKVDAEEAEREQRDDLADNDSNRVWNFFGAVRPDSAGICIHNLDQWARRDPGEPIKIVFNSPGGSVIDGLALYDFLEELKEDRNTPLTTVARGMAASMGGILLQAGQERVIGKNAHMLIHEISSMGIGKLSEMEDEVKFLHKLQDRALDILAERSTLSKRQIANRWKRKDWWLGAEEVVKFGFADRIG